VGVDVGVTIGSPNVLKSSTASALSIRLLDDGLRNDGKNPLSAVCSPAPERADDHPPPPMIEPG